MQVQRRRVLEVLGAAALGNLALPDLFAAGRALQARVEDPGSEHVYTSLDEVQGRLVATAADTILPETDTPGASSAKVDAFVDLLLAEWFTEEEKRRFVRGLERLSRDGFLEMSESARRSHLDSLERSTPRPAPSVSPAGAPFISVMKWLTVFAFFTSEAASELGLDFVAFEGAFEGCAPIRRSR